MNEFSTAPARVQQLPPDPVATEIRRSSYETFPTREAVIVGLAVLAGVTLGVLLKRGGRHD